MKRFYISISFDVYSTILGWSVLFVFGVLSCDTLVVLGWRFCVFFLLFARGVFLFIITRPVPSYHDFSLFLFSPFVQRCIVFFSGILGGFGISSAFILSESMDGVSEKSIVLHVLYHMAWLKGVFGFIGIFSSIFISFLQVRFLSCSQLRCSYEFRVGVGN